MSRKNSRQRTVDSSATQLTARIRLSLAFVIWGLARWGLGGGGSGALKKAREPKQLRSSQATLVDPETGRVASVPGLPKHAKTQSDLRDWQHWTVIPTVPRLRCPSLESEPNACRARPQQNATTEARITTPPQEAKCTAQELRQAKTTLKSELCVGRPASRPKTAHGQASGAQQLRPQAHHK